VIKATNRLRGSAEFELHALIEKKSEMFESVVAKQVASLEAEIGKLKGEAEELTKEMETITGHAAPIGR
jgi:cell division protein FtsB